MSGTCRRMLLGEIALNQMCCFASEARVASDNKTANGCVGGGRASVLTIQLATGADGVAADLSFGEMLRDAGAFRS